MMDLQMPIMDGMEALKRLRAAEHAMRQAEEAGFCSISTTVSVLQKSVANAAAMPAAARPPLPRSVSNGKLGHGSDMPDLESGARTLRPPLPPLPPVARRSNPSSSVSSADRRGRFHQFVLAVSANSDNETVQAALDSGADGFISKPFTYDSFTEAMQQQRGCTH
jgi:CheY-like chemotaxis protein